MAEKGTFCWSKTHYDTRSFGAYCSGQKSRFAGIIRVLMYKIISNYDGCIRRLLV